MPHPAPSIQPSASSPEPRALSPEPPQVTVILPTFNERESLPRVVKEIHDALRAIPHELIVVDDDSPDGTWRWVEAAQRGDPTLRLLRRRTSPGLGASVLDGFKGASADRWIVMDADGQHDPSILPRLFDALADHALVVCSRYAAGGSTLRWAPARWLGSRGATWLARSILQVPLGDPLSGYFGVRKDAFVRVASAMHPQGFKVLLELYCRLARLSERGAVDCVEVPYHFRARQAGTSKLSGVIVWQYLRMLMTLRRAGVSARRTQKR